MRPITLLALLSPCLIPAAELEPSAPKQLQINADDYIQLRHQATRNIPSLGKKATPEEITSHSQAMAQAIRGARAQAKQGEILTPAVQTYLTALVRSEMKGHAGQAARETAKDGNPAVEGAPVPVKIAVNAAYPDSAPLSSVPPTLLQRLPVLPKGLDFRFVGRHLVLRDAEAGLILDFVPNAIP